MKRNLLGLCIADLRRNKIIKRDAEVAKALNISQARISAFRTGRAIPTPVFVQQFEKLYQVKLEDYRDVPDEIKEPKEPDLDGLKSNILMMQEVINEKNKTIEDHRYTINNLRFIIENSVKG
jgi:transcriptional regulator with XRE-family HTH domain